ncbi:phosphatase PAP2 family protein [Lactococcus termiticola]|uniref:Membrane-associated phospholipid phosphatase n=1 Tax=Lactococcus termiticola TaxID=2169526 RepID=A0A2R5HIW4_9LACT|nr:phosphatase PAP2 family protein [Lactococcus termiticola]GBG96041.1 membrane-associated phospholipid phosphatase [Lactococcus termiticola]
MQNKKFYVPALVSLLLFILLTLLVKANYTHSPIPGFDPAIQNFGFQMQGNAFLLGISELIATLLGPKGGLVLSVLIFLVLFFAFRKRAEAIWFAGIIIVGVGFNTGLKVLIGRVRPDIHRIPAYAHEPGMSFASGHSLFATLIFGCLFLMLAQHLKSRAAQWLAGIIALLFIGLAMFSRILLGVHYPSDTVAGFLLGLFLICLSYPALKNYQKNRLL